MPTILFADPHILGETIGGAEVQLWILAKGFCNAGWDVHYITDAVLSEKQREGVTLHSLANCKANKHEDEFFTRLKEISPDIIYQRGRKSYTGLVGQFAAISNIPFIFSVSMDIDCQRYKELGRIFQHPKDSLRQLRILPRRYRQDISSLKGMRQATVILTQSEVQKSLMKKKLSLGSLVFRNLHSVPEKNKIKKNKPLMVLWLASVKRWKRPEAFIELAELLRPSDYKFVLAGRLADRMPYEKKLYAYSKENANFEYIESINFEESNELIAKASVFINTSEPFEGFPNTFIQSWLRNTVTLSLNVDPDELITRQNIGRLSGDLKTMSLQLKELLRDDQMRMGMGQDARDFAIDKFGYSKNFPVIESLAKELIDKNKAKKGFNNSSKGQRS